MDKATTIAKLDEATFKYADPKSVAQLGICRVNVSKRALQAAINEMYVLKNMVQFSDYNLEQLADMTLRRSSDKNYTLSARRMYRVMFSIVLTAQAI